MPSLLTIPREIRDQIYDWALLDTLPSSRNRALQRERKRIFYSASDPETHYGEEAVRYPVHTSLPPAHALLSTTRQLRKEFLDSMKRVRSLKYKVDLTDRKDKGVLSPTWISVPWFTDRIDVLEVHWRMRDRKTSSVATDTAEDEESFEVSSFSASLAMLQRFIERGIYLLSKKKAHKIHIGLLDIHLDRGPEISEEELASSVEEICEYLNAWMVRGGLGAWGGGPKELEHAQFELLASKIDKMQISAGGVLYRKWEIPEVVVEREEFMRQQNEERGEQAS